MSMRMRGVLPLALLVAASQAFAQGNLSTQGLGFPPGQLSATSKSVGGGSAEVDPLSALNPAAMGLVGSAIIYMQAEPEYRSVRIGAQTNRSSVARFPLFFGAQPVGERWVVGISVSTLLDRTWETSVRDSQIVATDTVRETRNQRSDGSINDLRLAVSFAPTAWLHLGVGAHAYTGRTALRSLRTFDNPSFSPDTQETTVGFGGNAVSLGVQGYWPKVGTIGASYRKGGHLDSYAGDSIVGVGNVPDHIGISAMYLGISGAAFSVRAGRDKWSSVAGLARGLNVHEGWEFGGGADVSGPRFGANVIALRAGMSWRTLPFSVNATAVKERSLSGGFAIPMAQRRVELSLGATRATRSGSVGSSESSWTLITGFAIRP